MKRSLWVTLAALSFACGSWAPNAFGQAVYGSILGTVTDPSGAAVAGATVVVTSVGKNTTSSVTTNESGNYSATHLIPDVYSVRVESANFKRVENKDIVVSVDTATRVDFALSVGGASETVEVTSEASQLKTDRADVSIEFTAKNKEK